MELLLKFIIQLYSLTVKHNNVKRLPKNLVISLKRFEFDYDQMVRRKINDYFEFPLQLNL